MSEPKKLFGMDATAQQTFVRYYRGLPEKPSCTIRFFNRIDYYTCHGSDALFTAQEVFKSTAVCKTIGVGTSKLEGVILNKSQFENFVRDLLLVKQYRVEVYVDKGSGRTKDWSLEYKGSPGNLYAFEDILFGNADVVVSGLIIAVKLGTEGKSKIVGLSCVDTISTTINVSEFVDDEFFSNLEAVIVANAPKECLLSAADNTPDYQQIKSVLERNNVMVTLRKKSEFSTESLFQDLNSLIKFKKGQDENVRALPETDLMHAMSATASIVKYLDLTADDGNIHQYKIEELKQSRYMKLDAAAIEALNIMPPRDEMSNTVFNGIATSIHGLLDKCRTPQGHRLMAQWVRQPLKDLSLINERHDIVEVLLTNQELRTAISEDHLKRIPDLEQLAKKLSRKKARLQDCYKIYQCINDLPALMQALSVENTPAALKALVLDPLAEHIDDVGKFQQMMDETLDFDALEQKEYLIKADFNDDLKELKAQMDSLREKIQSQFNKAANDLDMEAGKRLKLESNSIHGYYLRVTMRDEAHLRSNKKYDIFESNKTGVKFRTSLMTTYNEKYAEIKEKYEEEQKVIVMEICSLAASYSSSIKGIALVVATLDVLNSFALTAAAASKTYVRPEMLPSDAGVLKLVQARHPIVESQQDVNYIANDIEFKRGETQFHIITGPNMGGKSTHMKAAGVAVLLAHIGSFVPCTKATMSLHDSILARVGANDSQAKGISTFQKEMVEISTIIKNATCNSLVLIDELGRGTSTYDGRALAWSIAEYMALEGQAFCFFATHYHEITRLADKVGTVKNYYVTAVVDGDDVTFLYEVKPGICEQSYGIYIAKMANFSPDIIELAKSKQAELEDGQVVIFKGSDDPEQRKKIVNDADEAIEQFIGQCKNLDESLSAEELIAKISEAKSEILKLNNSYITALVN